MSTQGSLQDDGRRQKEMMASETGDQPGWLEGRHHKPRTTNGHWKLEKAKKQCPPSRRMYSRKYTAGNTLSFASHGQGSPEKRTEGRFVQMTWCM